MFGKKVWVSALLLPVFAVAARGGDADVDTLLKMIPSDMALTFVVTDFEALNSAAAAIAKKLDPETEPFGGPLDDVKRDLKMGDWIDFSKPFALAMRETDWNGVLFCGVVPDFEGKAKTIEGASKVGDVWKIVYGEGEGAETIYATAKGPYILGATSKALLEGVGQPEKSLAAEFKARGDVLGGRNVLIHVNMNRVRDDVLGGLASAAQMAPMLAMMAGPQSGADPAMITGMITAMVDAGTKFAEQVDYIDVTIDVGAKAIDATIATGYKKGTIKDYLAKQKPARGSFFTELEDQPYMFVAGYDMPGDESPFMDYMIEKVFAAMKPAAPAAPTPAEGDDDDAKAAAEAAAAEAKVQADAFEEMIKQTTELYGTIDSFNMLLHFTPNGLMEMGDYAGKDVPKIFELSKKILASASSTMQHMGMGAAGYEPLGTQKIGDVDVETFAVTLDETNPAAAQAAAFMGKDNKLGMGIRDKRVRFCLGGDDHMQQVFASKLKTPLSDSKFVKEALAALPAKHNVIVLFDIASVIPTFGTMMGMPAGGPVPPGPPISASISLSQEPARVDIHVPVRAIERIKQAVAPEEPM